MKFTELTKKPDITQAANTLQSRLTGYQHGFGSGYVYNSEDFRTGGAGERLLDKAMLAATAEAAGFDASKQWEKVKTLIEQDLGSRKILAAPQNRETVAKEIVQLIKDGMQEAIGRAR